MNERKDIGKAIREQFKDHLEAPSDGVWKSIESTLKEEGKKRPAPVWFWIIGGLSLLLVGSGIYYFASPDETLPNTDQIEIKPSLESNEVALPDVPTNGDGSSSVVERIEKGSEDPASVANKSIHIDNDPSISANDSAEGLSRKRADRTQNNGRSVKMNTADIASAEAKKTNSQSTDKKPTKEEISETETPTTNISEGNSSDKDRIAEASSMPATPKADKKASVDSTVAKTEKRKRVKRPLVSTLPNKKDSLAATKFPWILTATLNVHSYDLISNRAALTDSLGSSRQREDLTFGYGLHIGYQLTDRAFLQFGIQKVNYQSTINNVRAQSYGQYLTGVTFSPGINNLSIEQFLNGSALQLEQQISYIETPITFRYDITKKRFNISAHAGISTLFLDENEVIGRANGSQLILGKTKDLNELGFSVFGGLGAHYQISKHVKFNFEPQFKYFIKSYQDDGIKPISLGFVFGISYQF